MAFWLVQPPSQLLYLMSNTPAASASGSLALPSPLGLFMVFSLLVDVATLQKKA